MALEAKFEALKKDTGVDYSISDEGKSITVSARVDLKAVGNINAYAETLAERVWSDFPGGVTSAIPNFFSWLVGGRTNKLEKPKQNDAAAYVQDGKIMFGAIYENFLIPGEERDYNFAFDKTSGTVSVTIKSEKSNYTAGTAYNAAVTLADYTAAYKADRTSETAEKPKEEKAPAEAKKPEGEKGKDESLEKKVSGAPAKGGKGKQGAYEGIPAEHAEDFANLYNQIKLGYESYPKIKKEFAENNIDINNYKQVYEQIYLPTIAQLAQAQKAAAADKSQVKQVPKAELNKVKQVPKTELNKVKKVPAAKDAKPAEAAKPAKA